MNRPQRALVIGGGIAGPAVALFLARVGIEPLVFEAYPRVDHVGGGFQIAPNGLRVLAELGLAEAMLRAGVPSDGMCFRNHHGRTIGTVRVEHSGVAVNLTRTAFHRVLREGCEAHSIAINHERKLRDLRQQGDQVVAEFEDGERVTGDFLIGADGVHSRVRALLHPERAQARYTGMVGLGGFCLPGALAPPDPADADRLTFIVGPKHQLGYSRMTETSWGWWCHAQAETEAEKLELLRMPAEALRARMLERYRGWCAPTEQLIGSTESWLRTAIHDVPMLPSWSKGRVVLMGDAAHAMSPAGGQGASLALEDASLLARLLGDRGMTVEEAMARFESLQKEHADAVVKQAYANDRRSLKELGAVGQWMRDRIMMPMVAPMITRALKGLYERRV